MKATLNILFALVTVDLLILAIAMMQIAIDGQTGYWVPFWRVQAEFVLGLLG